MAFLWGNMKLNHCDISVRESAASLDLSFHLCINLPPVSASCYKKASYFQRCSLVSSAFCYSFWRRYLNGRGLALTIHSCLHIYQSILLSIFYLFLLFCTSRSPWFVATVVYHLIHHKCNAGMLLFLALCYMFALFCVPPPPLGCLPLSPSASHIYPQHDKMAICLVIHLQTPFPPERSISFSSFPPEKALLPDFSFISLSQIFHLSLLHPFHNISMPAI